MATAATGAAIQIQLKKQQYDDPGSNSNNNRATLAEWIRDYL